MYKKIITISLLLAAIINANSQESRKKDIISKGFFVNLGLAFPSQTFNVDKIELESGGSKNPVPNTSTSESQSLGVMPSIEIGNQWYFWKNEKMGVGLRVSWFQFGFSSYKLNNSDLNVTNLDLRFIKLAPQFTYALNNDMALDFSFEVAPTIFIGGASKNDNLYANFTGGFLFAPGVKFRYKIFAAGFDFGFGSPSSVSVLTLGDNTPNKQIYTFTGTASTLYPRIYLGFKF